MPKKNKGHIYEDKIYNLCSENGLIDSSTTKNAGYANNLPDIVLNLKGKKVPVEIKLDAKARFGGTAISYENKTFSIVNSKIFTSHDTITNHFYDNEQSYIEAMSFFGVEKFPGVTEKSRWQEAVKQGLLKSARVKFNYDRDIISIEKAHKYKSQIAFEKLSKWI